jgi:hypothetical protein
MRWLREYVVDVELRLLGFIDVVVGDDDEAGVAVGEG